MAFEADKNGDGFIDLSEFMAAFRCDEIREKLDGQRNLKEVFQTLDVNGHVSKHDFLKVVENLGIRMQSKDKKGLLAVRGLR